MDFKLEKQSGENETNYGTRLGEKLAEELQGLTNELQIKECTLKYWNPIVDAYPEEKKIKKIRTAFRKALEIKFPNKDNLKDNPVPGYYYTKPRGKDKTWEHLALWYATISREKWEMVGDKRKEEYKESFSKKPQTEVEPEIKTEVKISSPVCKLENMDITQLELDDETIELVESAIAFSGVSLAEFVRRACHVYAKSFKDKVKQSEEDLTTVSTEDLKSDAFRTHPGRAEELAKRAIYALKKHNDNCTEKDQKWMITQTSIQSLTGSKPATIKAILEKYQNDLDDHNQKHGLTNYDNRKTDKRKIEDDINLVSLVPDGLSMS